jgi:hypothetical protein
MNEQPYLGRLAAILLASAVVGCMLVAGVAVWLRPRQFDTHQEAVGYILDRHGIAYKQIRVIHTWPDTLDRKHYAADVVVQLSGTQPAIGRIICASGMSTCYLRLPKMGILHEPVPELTAPSPWLTWLKQRVLRFVLPSGNARVPSGSAIGRADPV